MQELALYEATGATVAVAVAHPMERRDEFAAPLDVEATIRLWLDCIQSKRTQRTYLSGARHFAVWFNGRLEGALDSFGALFSFDEKPAALALNRYKASMLVAGDKENTINTRLASVRSLLRFAYRVGAAKVNGAGLVESEPVQTYRDTRGYDDETLMDFLEQPFKQFGEDTVRGKRDFALMVLLCENALRRDEVCSLDVPDFSMREKRLAILGKGKGTQKTFVTLSPIGAGAVADYLFTAGHAWDKGALFRNLSRDPNKAGGRVTGEAIRLLVRGYGERLGIENVAPHKFRHSSATLALDLTDGNTRAVKKLTRHAKTQTLEAYDDNRQDFQGQMTNLISQRLNRKRRKKK